MTYFRYGGQGKHFDEHEKQGRKPGAGGGLQVEIARVCKGSEVGKLGCV